MRSVGVSVSLADYVDRMPALLWDDLTIIAVAEGNVRAEKMAEATNGAGSP